MNKNQGQRPLDGYRVIEMGQLLAGPFAASMLGYFGAEVIKIEPPGTGDPIRTWRVMKDGVSLWWHSLGRNKKSVTLDLRHPKGRALARELALKSDILVENFRPGTLEKWGLGPADLWQKNPGLIYGRISGYGQNGPYASKPGFASVCEGVGGFRYVNGFPGDAPVRPNLSIGDTLAGIHCVIGVLLACHPAVPGPAEAGPGHRRGAVRVGLQPDGRRRARVFRRGRRPRAIGLHADRHRSDQHLPLQGRQVRHHRRQRGLHLQAPDAGHRPAGTGG